MWKKAKYHVEITSQELNNNDIELNKIYFIEILISMALWKLNNTGV